MEHSTSSSDHAVVVKNLHKSFKDLRVLSGIDFVAPRGSVLALLGPNGAGKTTTVRILSTLLLPDSGEAFVNGYNVVKESTQARQSIGLTGQFAAVDDYLTGEENLAMIGRLYRLSKDDIDRRTRELLEQFDLVEAAKRPVRNYSGGMKRRIDLAMSLIAAPPIIFLDEPTTGLDPRSRLTMWTMIEQLMAGGTTIVLTTQYMDEADRLADRIVVIDNGTVIAEGTPDSLKARVGSDHVDVILKNPKDLTEAQKVLGDETLKLDPEHSTISIATKDGVAVLRKILPLLEQAHIEIINLSLRQPTLDDVFLTLTGHAAIQEKAAQKKKQTS